MNNILVIKSNLVDLIKTDIQLDSYSKSLIEEKNMKLLIEHVVEKYDIRGGGLLLLESGSLNIVAKAKVMVDKMKDIFSNKNTMKELKDKSEVIYKKNMDAIESYAKNKLNINVNKVKSVISYEAKAIISKFGKDPKPSIVKSNMVNWLDSVMQKVSNNLVSKEEQDMKMFYYFVMAILINTIFFHLFGMAFMSIFVAPITEEVMKQMMGRASPTRGYLGVAGFAIYEFYTYIFQALFSGVKSMQFIIYVLLRGFLIFFHMLTYYIQKFAAGDEWTTGKFTIKSGWGLFVGWLIHMLWNANADRILRPILGF